MDKKPVGQYERHIRLYHKLLGSHAYNALDYSSKALLIELRYKLNGSNNGNLSATLSELKKRGWASAATLSKALRQLEAVGILRKTRKTVGVSAGSKFCNLYRFTDLECFEFKRLSIDPSKPTHDYLAFKTLEAARAAVAAATPAKIKRTVQKMEHSVTETESHSQSIDADCE
ncbi:MAG: hypothetical protein EON54_13365, partial [Alcaligenaceae bacterium]